MNKVTKILSVVVTCLVIGYFSVLSLICNHHLVSYLIKPVLILPIGFFAPVWSMLYIMMGIAAGLVWPELILKKELVRKAVFS
jgi:tryptophan-rich sensory protein